MFDWWVVETTKAVGSAEMRSLLSCCGRIVLCSREKWEAGLCEE